jgi:4-deoxy-L-threo-5-hexosulose-uronate ketol-isomerase
MATMTQAMRHPPDPATFARMTTSEMRQAFLLEDLFEAGRVKFYYSYIDRAVIGGAVPGHETLVLQTCRELAAEYFAQRRELGVINIGGPGRIRVGVQEFLVERKEALYIGRGNPEVGFSSPDAGNPAQFYFVSYPAHTAHPCAKVGMAQAESTDLGNSEHANRRSIHKLIHPAGAKSCQLSLGFTEIASGSVWNTMPAHTHPRRSEIYMYFDLPAGEVVVHSMGEPMETRHLVIRNRQAVVSPSWSVHAGVGTTNYSFVWAMGGENQEFSDMDMAPMETLG